MSSFPASDPPFNPQKLVTSPLDKARVTEQLTVAVRDLGDAEAIKSTGCSSLIRKIRALFPELMQLRGDQDATIELRDRQVTELAPYLLGTNALTREKSTKNDYSDRESHKNPIDEVAHRMWEIAVTEQMLERYKAQEQSLRDEILASVNPEHLSLIRWALDQA